MTKTFKLQQLGCANCAAKMERAIKKMPDVNDARVNFMFSKLTLDAADARFDEIVDRAQTAISRIEPDCKIVR
ncbi:MAG: cation transporter [Eggerthellaceae bacterium]|jgi:copper chaperone CopZ